MKPAPTSNRCTPGPDEQLPEHDGVVKGAKDVGGGKITHSCQLASLGARGKDEAVEGEPFAARRRELFVVEVERDNAVLRTESELEAEGGDGRRRPEGEPVRRPLPCKELLREGRPVVREMLLLSDEHDRPPIAAGAQPLAGTKPCQPGADDEDGRLRHSHPLVSAVAASASAGRSHCSRRVSR